MNIDKSLISKLENLARLELNESEKELIRTDLEKILEMVHKLDDLDTTGVEPLIHMADGKNVYREDVVEKISSLSEALKNAPKSSGNYFSVPKVIDQKK